MDFKDIFQSHLNANVSYEPPVNDVCAIPMRQF